MKVVQKEKLISKTARLAALGIIFSFWTMFAAAQVITTNNFSFSPNRLVPDDNFSGLALTTNLSGMNGMITNVIVALDITGGFNGDLYAYLAGPNGGIAILLNRPGITSGNDAGYDDTGFNITINDTAGFNNLHDYQNSSYSLNGSGQLTDNWSSDGRAIDPRSDPADFDTVTPTEFLTSLNGTDPNGTWTLFVADLSGGEQSTVVNWALTVETVPEPSTCALLGIGSAIFLTNRKRLCKLLKW